VTLDVNVRELRIHFPGKAEEDRGRNMSQSIFQQNADKLRYAQSQNQAIKAGGVMKRRNL
jgi:hypothetical protein